MFTAVGQTCVFADTETSNALTVVVIVGSCAGVPVAAAIGTVCNRIYGSGSTNPAPALAALFPKGE